MKIAIISAQVSPLGLIDDAEADGQNIFIGSLATELGNAGHEVEIYTRQDREEREVIDFATNVKVCHIQAGPKHPLHRDELLPHMPEFGAQLARSWQGNETPDLVYSHFWVSGLAALIATRGLPSAVVHTFHELGLVERRHQGRNDTSPRGRIRLERAVGHDVARVVALSTDEVRELSRLGVRRAAISLVPGGVDVTKFTPEGPTEPRGERPRILCVGRLIPRKGFDAVIRALQWIPDAEVLIAGGPDEKYLDSDREAVRLRQLAASVQVADRVWLLGNVSRDRMPGLMRSADVVVCSPWYEPFGLVSLEAMACGVPVVASAVGGFLDTVVDGATGVLVPPRQPVALALAIRALLDDPFRREGYGIAGIDRVRSRYSWQRVASDMLGVYEEVLSSRQEWAGIAS